ncbi:MAG: acyl-CoA dehydrogenase family protein [Spirochaetes bacterium]|nr:acyl-CoA dehydrogenase family protein [Spirochaetota bacterium]
MKQRAPERGILAWLLENRARAGAVELPSLMEWKKLFDDETAGWDTQIDRAVIGGFLADRTAYALAAGYESALRRLVPSLPERAIVSLCVTEETGAHPASIRSTLRRDDGPAGGWALNGGKKFITMASEADLLLVAASTGTAPDGKNMLRMALVERKAPGVEIFPMTDLPFVPEISHGTAAFREVPVREVDLLGGDGYRDYIRPFRTIEDLHVSSAVTAYLFGVACRFGWPAGIRERIAALLVCGRALALDDPSSPAAHIAIGGLYAQTASALEAASGLWISVDEKTRTRWERDRALLGIAEKARKKRLETAWSKFS